MKVTIVSCKRTALFGCSNFNSTIYWGSFLTKEIFTFFVFFFLFVTSMSGQPMINWQRCLGGTMGDNAYNLCEARDGSYMVAGISNSTNGDVVGPNLGSADIWVLKLDTAGNIIWQRNYGGDDYDNAQSIIQTADGGFIMAGTTKSGNVPGRNGSSDYDLYIVRIDSLGNLLWDMSYGGRGDDGASEIIQTPSGDFYAFGYSASSDSDVSINHGSKDYWLIKIDSLGTLLSEHSYGGSSYDWGTNIILDSNGVLHLMGYSASIDGDVQGNHGGQDYWLVNVDSTGAILSNFSYGGTHDDYASSMIKDGSNLVIAGWASSDDGDVSGHHGLTDESDIWVVKVDSTGSIIWNKSYGSTRTDFQGILQKDRIGNYLLFGTIGESDGDVSFSNGAADYWVCYIDSIGNLIWERSAGGSRFEFFYGGILTTSNKIILCGNSDSPNSGDVTGYHGGIGGDLWLVSFSDFSTSISSNLSISEPVIYPNPFNGELKFRLNNFEGLSYVKVFDVLGNIHYLGEKKSQPITLDLSFLKAGIYELNIYNTSINKTFKIVKK